ncbi:hypothetical protein COCON_G00078420 [Conger conger]|uniref:Zinc finger and BTB domain-containing protein 44 n=1 Tax=Conger conger TaxID=82655 RepID=A0A9Q1DP61_CONCO|nr:hypothetical protein COCON_G00078420 [Conger conger]
MNGQTRNRQKRFVSAARYVETLVVADSSMTRFYGDEIKHYILTLVAMAAQIYKHPSLKNSVSMVVVKVLVVEDEDVGPEISSNGGVTLRNFCNWQQLFNPSSHRHPEHYDTAVLFTRKMRARQLRMPTKQIRPDTDICGHQSCDTLGVADVGTMCDPKRSCSVIEDNGLQAAFTLAHELDLRMAVREPGGHHLMAPFFVHLNKTLPWSPCSALYITEFFDSGHELLYTLDLYSEPCFLLTGDCLLDVPGMTVPLPAEVPARAFSLDVQCQQVFGGELEHCPNTSDTDVCSKLWCRERGQLQCLTKNGSLAWADGTPCGSNRTCLNGVCVGAEEVLQPKVVIDGGWGPWGPWGDCSRTCGGGVEFSHRDCTHPEPQDGGRYCEGQRVKYQSCNTRPCGNNKGKSFREEQCEKYNSVGDLDIHGNIRQWIPKYAGVAPRDRCKLFCRVRGGSEFRVFESKVIDGTTCGPDTTSVCVLGQCVKAGCDRVIGSNQRLDKCGVCGGNGSSCRKVTGSMNKAMYGYNDVVTIPAGATNIDVKQRSHRGIKHDGNYLAIKGETGGYILNGNFSVSTVEQDIPVSGAVLKYSGSSTTLERIQSFQQLREAVTIQLLATAGDATPPKIKYTFFIPKDVSFRKHSEKKASLNAIQPFGTSHWVLGEWSDCSKSCGSGWSRRTIDCRDGGGFPSFLCDEQLRPSDIKPCGDLPCPIWQMGPWSSCSRTCGLGQRHRSIHCLDYAGKIVEPKSCDPEVTLFEMGVKTFTHSSPTHSQEMLEKLNALRNEGQLCDVTIRVQDKIFMAHKVVLACCSEFLRAKLAGLPDGADKFVLDLHHVTVSGFTPLLEYAYTSTLSISTENIIDVLAAASYMQMFAVASTCSEFMKSSILWNAGGAGGGAAGQEKPRDSASEATPACTLTPLEGSLSPVSSECSVAERPAPSSRQSRESRRKEFRCHVARESAQQSTLPWPSRGPSPSAWTGASTWTRPSSRAAWSRPGPPRAARRLADYLTCEGPKEEELEAEEDVRVKVERLSDEEVHEEASQAVSASQSSLSDQQTVPGSEQVQEELLISPQSSSIGSIDEGVAEGLPSIQGTSNSAGHAEDDERLENVQYPYHLYISPSARPGTNGPDRPFQCPTCGVRFTRIQNLKQHMLIHSGIKPFQCDRCGKKFTRAYSLKMHRLKHEGKRCFRCQICSATFTSFGEYKHHMRVSRHIIRKPRVYECKTCGAMFTNSGNLIVHLRSLNHEASELANYFQSSDFLVPDYLSQVQEEALGQYDLAEHGFHSSSSVQMPVISQVSSTQNCSATFPHSPPGPLTDREEEEEEDVEEVQRAGTQEPKIQPRSRSLGAPEDRLPQEVKEELASTTVEYSGFLPQSKDMQQECASPFQRCAWGKKSAMLQDM